MSYDKNTINMSQVDTYTEMLTELGIPYYMLTMRTVHGRGINDGEGTLYLLRRLQYNNNVILECIEQTADCDDDDYIYSCKFKVGNAPSDWKYVRQVA